MVGNTRLPPGFRFHPTDVELVRFYLKRKVMGKKLPFHCIEELDLYKFPPWDLPLKSVLRTGDLKWYFFCPREKKYASGTRMNRATEFGYWKTTGKDRTVLYDNEVSGMIKTLVFHRGKAPKGERTDWVMYEYRLDDKKLADSGIAQDSYVLSVIFKKDGPGPKNGAQYGAPFKEEDWELEDDDEEEVNDIGAALWAGGSTTTPPKVLSVDPINSVPEGSCVVSPLSCLSAEKANAPEAPVTPDTANVATEGVSEAPALEGVPKAQVILEEPLESAQIGSIGVPEAGHEEDDEVLAMLAYFSEEAPFTMNDIQNIEVINDPNQAGVISDPNQTVAPLPWPPALNGNEIYNNLGDLGNLAPFSEPQGLVNGYAVDDHNNPDFMFANGNDNFLELMDLDTPLNSFQQQQQQVHNQYGDSRCLQQQNNYNNNNNVCDDLLDFVNSCWKHSGGSGQ